jgi:glycosyltransferase involved in cell wall biosynthesis
VLIVRIGITALSMYSESGFAKAGVSRYCSGLIDGLAALPHQHEIVVFTNSKFEAPDRWAADGRMRFVKSSGALRDKVMLWNALSLSKIATSLKLDVVLSTAHALPLFGKFQRALVVHDLFVESHPEFFDASMVRKVKASHGKMIRLANRLLPNSDHTKSELRRIYAVPDEKMRRIYLALGNVLPPVERSAIDRERVQALGVPFERFIFTIGTLEPRKNIPRLLDAFVQLQRKQPDPSLGLVIAGGKGWKDAAIWETVEQSGLKDQVVFLGYVEDAAVPVLMAACEFYVLPSLMEGFGIPALEALHFGAPLVASNGGALPEVAGPRAILFDPLDTDQMSSALEKGLSIQPNREEIIAEGKAFAAQFTWERTARETLAELEKLKA